MRSQSGNSTAERARFALWGDGTARTRTTLAVLFLVACIGYLVAVHVLGIETEVMRDRFWKNAEPLFHGIVPVTEYPPLALVFIAIPRLFGSDPWGYEVAYVAMIYVFMVAGLCLVSRLASSMGRDGSRAMVAYGILVLLMLEFVLDRFDIVAMVLTLAAAVLFVERRTAPAFILLAAATLTKVYPAMFFPIMILALLYERRYRDAGVGAASFVLTGVAAVAVCALLNPDLITVFVEYNGGRPLQVESVVASVLYLFSMTGMTDMWIQPASAESFWSDNLRGTLPDALSPLMLPVAVACLAAVWLLYAYLRGRAHGDHGLALFSLASLVTLLTFLVVNKVFSSQYLIWAIGPVLMVLLTSAPRSEDRLFWVVAASMALVQLDFAYNVGYLGGGAGIDDLGMLIILAKNVVVIYALWLSLRSMVRTGRELRRQGVPGAVANS